MKSFLKRFSFMIFGLFLYGLGLIFTIKSTLGFPPWEVLNSGISKITGISLGTVGIMVGFVIVLVIALLGETIGIGTIFNMLLIGTFINLLLPIDMSFFEQNVFLQLFLLIFGLFTIGFGAYFYMNAGFGAGPRDSIMVYIRRKTHLSIGLSKLISEGGAILLGFALGGEFGIGTVISALVASYCVQTVFSIMKFDAAAIKHENLKETLSHLKTLVNSSERKT